MREMTIGAIIPAEYKNGCCAAKPIELRAVVHDDGKTVYSCTCACGVWCTTGHRTPAEAIMEYEVMCRTYPKHMEWGAKDLFERYKSFYADEGTL